MERAQAQSIRQESRQELQLGRQQIQALELLAMPAADLQAVVGREIESNPLLETGPEDAAPGEADDDCWLEQVLKLDEDARYIKSFKYGFTPEDEERRRFFLESVTERRSLHDLLNEQLRMLDLPPDVRDCCDTVLASLDDDGYLRAHPADLAMASGHKAETVARAVAAVKSLDPAGVGAADLRERILLQLARKGEEETDAYVLVRDHLPLLASNQLPAAARAAGIPLARVKAALARVQALNPRLDDGGEPTPGDYIREEVVVEIEEGRPVARVRNESLPSIRIAPQYRKLLESPDTPKETRDYVKEKIRAGVFFINSIIQRQTTIKKIADAIVALQEEFFLKGPGCLRPMTMADVARKAGVHETTVSRAAAGKFIRCPWGLAPMRDLFSTGYQSQDGGELSRNVVMEAIRLIIAAEDAASPLSDIEIAKALKAKGFDVARRTVAKYREMLGIRPSNLRREY